MLDCTHTRSMKLSSLSLNYDRFEQAPLHHVNDEFKFLFVDKPTYTST